MEEVRKSFYSIQEAAKIKGVTEEELFDLVRKGSVQTKQIGFRLMVIAESLTTNNETNHENNRVERHLKQLQPDLNKMLEEAPEYGSCGIEITFHGGKITKINRQLELTRLEEKK